MSSFDVGIRALKCVCSNLQMSNLQLAEVDKRATKVAKNEENLSLQMSELQRLLQEEITQKTAFAARARQLESERDSLQVALSS